MGNFVLQKDPIHFLLGCLILISLLESGFRVISDQIFLCQNNRKCQAARTMMANLTWRHCKNRSEGSALNSLNFFVNTYKGFIHRHHAGFSLKMQSVRSQPTLLPKARRQWWEQHDGMDCTARIAV